MTTLWCGADAGIGACPQGYRHRRLMQYAVVHGVAGVVGDLLRGQQHDRNPGCLLYVPGARRASSSTQWPTACAEILALIGELYAVEPLMPRPFPGEATAQAQRQRLRQERSRPILDRICRVSVRTIRLLSLCRPTRSDSTGKTTAFPYDLTTSIFIVRY